MSVLVKGLEMPKSCSDCKIRLSVGCCGNLPQNTRMPNCPLVPIPPHGRLIDADVLEQDAQKRLLICNKYDNQFQKPYEVMSAIALAPTIIEAEEE